MKYVLSFLLIGISITSFGQLKTAQEYAEASYDFEAKEKYDLALENILKAILLDGSQLEYYMTKGRVLEEMNNMQAAYDSYSEAISVFPDEAEPYGSRARVLYYADQYEQSFDDYEIAMKLVKNDTLRYYLVINRSTVKAAVKDFQGAYDDLMNCYKWDSTEVGTIANLAAVCEEWGRPEERMIYLKKLVQLDTTFYDAYLPIGFDYQEKGNHQEAINCFNTILKYVPNDPYALNNRSLSRLALGDTKGAMEDVTASLKGDPENSYAYKNRGMIYLKMKKISKACEDFQLALDKGFTALYGDEVEKLQKEHCSK